MDFFLFCLKELCSSDPYCNAYKVLEQAFEISGVAWEHIPMEMISSTKLPV